ncbi:MAG: hypothetical protein AAGI50_09935 [Pseudomonadota bacterium]
MERLADLGAEGAVEGPDIEPGVRCPRDRERVFPGPTPGLCDRGRLAAPGLVGGLVDGLVARLVARLVEGRERLPGGVGGLGTADLAELGGDGPAIRPGPNVRGTAQRMA